MAPAPPPATHLLWPREQSADWEAKITDALQWASAASRSHHAPLRGGDHISCLRPFTPRCHPTAAPNAIHASDREPESASRQPSMSGGDGLGRRLSRSRRSPSWGLLVVVLTTSAAGRGAAGGIHAHSRYSPPACSCLARPADQRSQLSTVLNCQIHVGLSGWSGLMITAPVSHA